MIAVIDAAKCIGCVKCVRACPEDAILGAAKQIHVVLSLHCTGCGLCLPPCPVDCISLVKSGKRGHTSFSGSQSQTEQGLRARYATRQHREQENTSATTPVQPVTAEEIEDKRAYIKVAISRSRARREGIRRAREPDRNSGDD